MTQTRPLPLVAIALAGQGVGWLLSLLVARTLGVEAFEAYAVAAALFILLATLAPLGSEKHALRHLPAMLDRGDATEAQAFLRFGLLRTLTVALVAGILVAAWALLALPAGDLRLAIWMTCLSLPAGALAHYGVEAVTAAGHPGRALLLFRLLVPLVALLSLLLAIAGPWAPTGAAAVAGWGLGWAVALAAMAAFAWRRLPAGLKAAPPPGAGRRWRREALPFLIHRLSMSVLMQAPILALERWGPEQGAVGAYAAAAGTVGLVAVLATSTNRAYARELGLHLDRGDIAAVRTARRARLAWLAPVVALFLLAIFLLSSPILALFRPEFVDPGRAALRILALSSAFTVLFALAPTWLKFRARNRLLYGLVAGAALVQLALLALLVPPFGATGAAAAHAAAMIGLYAAFALIGLREVAAPTPQG